MRDHDDTVDIKYIRIIMNSLDKNEFDTNQPFDKVY
jgi:hypothetical protein